MYTAIVNSDITHLPSVLDSTSYGVLPKLGTELTDSQVEVLAWLQENQSDPDSYVNILDMCIQENRLDIFKKLLPLCKTKFTSDAFLFAHEQYMLTRNPELVNIVKLMRETEPGKFHEIIWDANKPAKKSLYGFLQKSLWMK